MREALALAQERLGFTTPNPSVGCVIVRGDKVVGRGVTGIGGRPHGEAVALADSGRARARCDGVRLVRAVRAFRADAAVR